MVDIIEGREETPPVPTTTVTNKSSRSFEFGDMVLLPRVPQDMTDEQVSVLKQHQWSEFFTFEPIAEPPSPPEEPPP